MNTKLQSLELPTLNRIYEWESFGIDLFIALENMPK